MNGLDVEPSACTWCGIAERGHGRQYADAAGWHAWAQPSQEQILARMKARRLQLAVVKAGALPVPVVVERPVNELTATFMPVASLRASLEDPHDGPLARTYRVGRDLDLPGGPR